MHVLGGTPYMTHDTSFGNSLVARHLASGKLQILGPGACRVSLGMRHQKLFKNDGNQTSSPAAIYPLTAQDQGLPNTCPTPKPRFLNSHAWTPGLRGLLPPRLARSGATILIYELNLLNSLRTRCLNSTNRSDWASGVGCMAPTVF